MTTCASRATQHFPELHSWASLYNQNQGFKYFEAITILYNRDMLLNKRKLIYSINIIMIKIILLYHALL